MNIRIFLFNEQPGKSAERTVNAIKHVFADYLPDDDSVKMYPGIRDAVDNISKALRDSHVIIFLSTPDKYADIKKKLANTFNIKMQVNEELQSKAFTSLNKIITNSSSEEYAHCVVPVNSRIFSLEDGLYSGFSAVSGNQTIICLPWETGRTEVLLTKQVIPYINSAYRITVSPSAFRDFNCKRLSEDISSGETDFAIAKTNTSQYFLDYINDYSTITEAIKDTQRSEKRGNLPPEKYIINLSIMAKELASTEYGIAMSNAYYSGSDSDSEKIIYLAVTNDKKTSVREIHSVSGEEVEDFLERTSGDLCTFISDVIETENETSKAVEEAIVKKVKNYKLGIAAVSAAIAVLIAVIVVVFTSNHYTIRNWFVDVKKFIFPSQGEIETTIISSDSLTDQEENFEDDTEETVSSDESTEDDESIFVAG